MAISYPVPAPNPNPPDGEFVHPIGTQLRLFGANDEAELFHDPTRTGYFAILVQEQDRKRQTTHRLTLMPEVLAAIDTSRDTWLSQAEFTCQNRKVVNLLRVGLLFSDLDTYRMDFARGRSPESLADAVLYWCLQEGIPTPSILVFSGRGIQAKWLLEGALPRRALPRWNACQKALVDRLGHLGADPGARDASRVLRLVSTVNSKSGEVCRVVHVAEDAGGEPVRYKFEYLCEQILPFSRVEIEAERKARAERRQLRLLPGANQSGLKGFSGRELAWHRLEDLRLLASIRGGVSEGQRMKHLFWQLNFLLLSGATSHNQMYHEAATLAKEIDPRWSYGSSELSTLYAKAKAYEAGEHVEFGGQKFTPLYTPKNDKLIELFEITDAEQKLLQTIISPAQARERHRARDESRRRAKGVVDRVEYLRGVEGRRARAQELKSQGFTKAEIARELGVSVRSVAYYIAAGQ